MSTRARLRSQSVRVDSVKRAPVAFGAARGAPDFAWLGFATDSDGGRTFFGPDAEVLLDDRFTDAYCFNIAAPKPDRRNQVGLEFVAADRRRDRVDVQGVLWIDTVSRTLVDIDYLYRGLGEKIERRNPGGHIEFHTMPNGVALVQRWSLRMVHLENESRLNAIPGFRESATVFETGGALARASWPDGTAWSDTLATLAIHVARQHGAPAAGAIVWLAGTDYHGTADSSGNLEIHDLVPGPYIATLTDPRLAVLGLETQSPHPVRVARDSVVHLSLTMPADVFASAQCRSKGQLSTGAVIVGRVVARDGSPIRGAKVMFSEVLNEPFIRRVAEPVTTKPDGIFTLCGAELTLNSRIRIRATHPYFDPAESARVVGDSLMVVLLRMGAER